MSTDNARRAQVQRFYDVEASSYDASRYETPRGRRRDRFHKELLLHLLDVPTSRRVLEIGCGTGRFLEVVSQAGYQIAGTDLSANMLSQARRRLEQAGIHDVPLLQTSGLPFPKGTFAAVYSIFVVNLIPDYRRWLEDVAAILAPGGVLAFNVPNLSSVYWPFGQIINRRRRTSTTNSSGARYSHWFSRREWKAALSKAGFHVEAVYGEPPWCGSFEHSQPLDGESPGAWLCKSLFVKARLDSP